MTYIKSAAFLAASGTFLYTVAFPMSVAKAVVKTAIGASAIVTLTATGALLGAYKGGSIGAKWGERQAGLNPGSGAFEIPFGFAVGGIVGLVVAGSTTFVLSTTISAVALTIF